MRVLVCDDTELFADAMAAALTARRMQVVARLADPAQVAAAAAGQRADVCLMELRFRSGSGLDWVAPVLAAAPDTKVVFLSAWVRPGVVARALALGASGVVGKTEGLDAVVGALRAAGMGETSVRVPADEPRRTARGRLDELGRLLTSRELVVLERLVGGQAAAEMARELDISYRTVRAHVQSILTKLGVHSKLEAVAFATAGGQYTWGGAPG